MKIARPLLAAPFLAALLLSACAAPDGKQDVSVSEAAQSAAEAAATEALEQWQFEPATKNGKPVAVRYIVTLKFNLK